MEVRLRATRFGETGFASASDSPARTKLGAKRRAKSGGEAGIRTLGTTLRSYNGLANRRLQPLGHLTVRANYCRTRTWGFPLFVPARELWPIVPEIVPATTS